MEGTMWTGFQKPKRLSHETETISERYGKFFAQPFERGFGTTIGNSLRRALLSSIEGAAITAVRIEGVLHEFSSIPGVVEDATDIILNLKQIPFKMHTSEPKTLRVSRSEPGMLKSGDIETDADFEVLDPNIHLATVSEGGDLNIEMRSQEGTRIRRCRPELDDDLPVGYIPVDSVHSPVKKVNFHVEAARLGQDTDYDKLTLEVWTNGSVSPERAVGLAAKLIKDHMQIFISFEEDSHETGVLVQRDRDRPTMRISIVQSMSSSFGAGLQLPEELRHHDHLRDPVPEDRTRNAEDQNFGRKSLNEIKDILAGMGLGFGLKFDDHGNLLQVAGQD
jgi:DNA-directed RNA polymerase subunit alpha